MNNVEIDPKRPVMINAIAVASFRVKPQTWVGYMNGIASARNADGEFGTALFREWALKHVEPLDATGKPIAFALTDLLQFPASYGFRFQKHRSEEINNAGEIVKDGDGIDAPCTFKLGKPLDVGSITPVTELEFMVRTIGDIEPIMLMSSSFDQTDALIRNCATPLGGPLTLQRLTEHGMAGLTVEDGIAIMNKVLPRFFV